MAENVMAKIKTENRGGARKNAGRKPKASTKGAYFSTRLAASTRDRLEREAEKSGLSLSNEIQRRLVESLDERNAWGPPHVRDLARLVMHLATQVEGASGKSWNADRFTYEALKAAFEITISWLAPENDVIVPAHLEEMAKLTPGLTTPTGYAAAVALGLRDRMRADPPTGGHPKTHHIPNSFYELPALGDKLALKRESEK
jgi:hypothetical protein